MSMKPLSSVTTTAVKATGLQTSTQPTGTGSVVLSDGEQKKAVAHLLSHPDPQVVTRKVTDLVHTLIPSLTPKYSSNFDLLGFRITGKVQAAALTKAIKAVSQSLQPMDTVQCEKQIAMMLPLLTLPRDLDDKMLSLKSRTLASELAKYPADIVMRSFEDVKKTSTFFPSFAEFYRHIEWRYLHRKYLMDALQKCIPSAG